MWVVDELNSELLSLFSKSTFALGDREELNLAISGNNEGNLVSLFQ